MIFSKNWPVWSKFWALNEEQAKCCTVLSGILVFWASLFLHTRIIPYQLDQLFFIFLCDPQSTCVYHYDKTDWEKEQKNDQNDAIFTTHPSLNEKNNSNTLLGVVISFSFFFSHADAMCICRYEDILLIICCLFNFLQHIAYAFPFVDKRNCGSIVLFWYCSHLVQFLAMSSEKINTVNRIRLIDGSIESAEKVSSIRY